MKLQMGDIETQAVCYEDGTVAHRRPAISHQPQFSFEQLKELVRRWNGYEDGGLVDELRTTLENALTTLAIISMPRQDDNVATDTELLKILSDSFRAALAKS